MTGLARKQRKQRKSRRRSRYARKTRRRKGAGDDEYEKIFEVERQERRQPEMDPSVLDDAARIAALDDEDEILARLRQQLEALGTWPAEHGNNGNGNINVNVANMPTAPTFPVSAASARDVPGLQLLADAAAELNTPTAPPPLAIPVGQAPLATTIDPANVNNARNIPTAPGAWSGGDKRRRKSKKGRRSRRRKRRSRSRSRRSRRRRRTKN